jgi:fatty-acid desaturase
MVKHELHMQQVIANLATQVGQTTAAAQATTGNAHAVATAAGSGDHGFHHAPPSKYGNKKKDADIRQWLLVIEDYLRTAPICPSGLRVFGGWAEVFVDILL